MCDSYLGKIILLTKFHNVNILSNELSEKVLCLFLCKLLSTPSINLKFLNLQFALKYTRSTHTSLCNAPPPKEKKNRKKRKHDKRFSMRCERSHSKLTYKLHS